MPHSFRYPPTPSSRCSTAAIIERAANAPSDQNSYLRTASSTRRDLRAPDGGVILTGLCQSLASLSSGPLLPLPSSVFARIGSSNHHNILLTLLSHYYSPYQLPPSKHLLRRLTQSSIYLVFNRFTTTRSYYRLFLFTSFSQDYFFYYDLDDPTTSHDVTVSSFSIYIIRPFFLLRFQIYTHIAASTPEISLQSTYRRLFPARLSGRSKSGFTKPETVFSPSSDFFSSRISK